MSKPTVIAFAFFVGVLLPQVASAQMNPDSVPSAGTGPVRSGFTGGLSIGRGSIDVACERCGSVPAITEALSLTAHAGFMVLPRIAILGEHWTVRYNDRGSEWFDDTEPHLVAQRIFAVAGQAFVGERLWLKAGVGVGWHISDSQYTQGSSSGRTPVLASQSSAQGMSTRPQSKDMNNVSPAYFAAVGYEFAHNDFFAADIQLRVGATRRPRDEYQIYNSAVNIGFNWY